jgi:hypothetical protein
LEVDLPESANDVGNAMISHKKCIVEQSIGAYFAKQFGSYLDVTEERMILILLECGCAVGLNLSLGQLISIGGIAVHMRDHTSESFVVMILTTEMWPLHKSVECVTAQLVRTFPSILGKYRAFCGPNFCA